MEQYAHIIKMEHCMVEQQKLLQEMSQLLDAFQKHREEYRALLTYYYSEQREQDLADDSKHLIPETMHRGVLSEDEIFDLIGEYRDTAIQMLDVAVQMLKE